MVHFHNINIKLIWKLLKCYKHDVHEDGNYKVTWKEGFLDTSQKS